MSAPSPHSARIAPRSRQHLTRLKRMSCHAEVHEYWGFRSAGNEGVYIVTSRTHYPPNRLTPFPFPRKIHTPSAVNREDSQHGDAGLVAAVRGRDIDSAGIFPTALPGWVSAAPSCQTNRRACCWLPPAAMPSIDSGLTVDNA